MADKPRNVVVLVADSLRFDSVYNAGIGMPYVQNNAVAFTEARSGGCWTLPATASIFTGRMPHEHGATAQTRAIHKDIPTLAEEMKAAGYNTYQITANIATTHIFGLHRGFDEVRRIWQYVDPKFSRLQQLLVLVGKPRLRKKLMSKDLLMQRMSEDLDMAKTWLQYTFDAVFSQAREIIRKNEAKGERTFLFLNLMETHFPYHIAPTFGLTQSGIFSKLSEVVGLFHLVNQTFLKRGKQNIGKSTLEVLKKRQQRAWESLAPHVNNFCQEIHEGKDNIMIFGADHGENFGETGWTYHFSNVTDAGNKVPLFWLQQGQDAREVDTPISTRDIYHSLLQEVGRPTEKSSILRHPEASYPIMQSFWYNNKGKTQQKYRYNQIAFLHDEHRFMWRNGDWFQAPFQTDYDEPVFEAMGKGINPLEELVQDSERKGYYRQTLQNFETFASKIKF